MREGREATVIAPGREYKEIAINRIDGRTLAWVAVDGSTIYLRSATHLYRIDESKAK